ncbi:MlaC/ttg2D family ABC transporter substrate-binding protein [Mameliella sediminis]|uniref:MlaC/ttg2D family ABC transporter substrate-binding protein n=1 Tax=Mameliella sediminis TaxID=2836866 RepID=UPI001C46AC8B|nr:ABC transporter substrate-binding protein [Mameliella sediminis]MBY6113132.1 ABC transporter substrate-binding protein [Antarctobacter heliothermus]MBY6143520.1 ABC transporter substrate-binding protein [Mameliella alba]MBV7394415.1 ABC transporter substrate-binding protein [Mameliella sediminis]MBY6162600.1 ABC transporter substrate-binding protein [Mameliella alba]MBY6171959.1 ABC transporter substrate-binding protein [Mameliella alba]
MTHLTRRAFFAGSVALSTLPAMPAFALTDKQAVGLINGMVAEINTIIEAVQKNRKSESAMFQDFERIFKKYGDTPRIAATVLGTDARRASNAQRKAFTDAFTGFIARKYGKQFRKFIGGDLQVKSVGPIPRGFQVKCQADLQGSKPFDVVFFVLETNRFYNMHVDGVDLLQSEKTTIGSMLDARRGDIDALISDLRSAS